MGCGNSAATRPTDDSKATKPTKAEPSEYEKLEGKWKMTDAQRDGKTFMDDGKPYAEGSTFSFTTGRVTGHHDVRIYVGSLKSIFDDDFEVAPEKSPKEMNIGTKPDSIWKKVAIYKLDGDTLTICDHSKERPKDFTTKPGDERTLYVLKRDSVASK
jgi:uncharacterized protein (TIGR03067 family)